MGINAYKTIKQATNTASSNNYDLFNSIYLWLNDAVAANEHAKKMEYLLNAQYLLTTTIERIPSGIPDEEAEPLMHILLMMNRKLNACVKNSKNLNRSYLSDVFEGLESFKKIYKS